MCEALPFKVEDARSRWAERAAGLQLHDIGLHRPSSFQAASLAFHLFVWLLSLVGTRPSYTRTAHQHSLQFLILSLTLAVSRLQHSPIPNVNDGGDHKNCIRHGAAAGWNTTRYCSQTSRYMISKRGHKRAEV